MGKGKIVGSFARVLSPLPVPHFPRALTRTGFTLLELMIVITIIIILAAIVLPQYQRTILATREAVLRDNLYKMRSLLDQLRRTNRSCRSRWTIWSLVVICATCRKTR